MESPTVLCIDDLPQALELRKATLESHGYCVKIASSGHAAMKMLEEVSVVAVLLDYKLEGMDAEAVAAHIKQRFPDLPIILLSAYSEMPEGILWLVDEIRDEERTAGTAGADRRKRAPALTTFGRTEPG
jgi:CheY-like chemotaxis protein